MEADRSGSELGSGIEEGSWTGAVIEELPRKPKFSFSPHKAPRGSAAFNEQLLNDGQWGLLKEQKMKTITNDVQYMEKNPQVEAFTTLLLKGILESKPKRTDVRKFIRKFVKDPDLEFNIRKYLEERNISLDDGGSDSVEMAIVMNDEEEMSVEKDELSVLLSRYPGLEINLEGRGRSDRVRRFHPLVGQVVIEREEVGGGGKREWRLMEEEGGGEGEKVDWLEGEEAVPVRLFPPEAFLEGGWRQPPSPPSVAGPQDHPPSPFLPKLILKTPSDLSSSDSSN